MLESLLDSNLQAAAAVAVEHQHLVRPTIRQLDHSVQCPPAAGAAPECSTSARTAMEYSATHPAKWTEWTRQPPWSARRDWDGRRAGPKRWCNAVHSTCMPSLWSGLLGGFGAARTGTGCQALAATVDKDLHAFARILDLRVAASKR